MFINFYFFSTTWKTRRSTSVLQDWKNILKKKSVKWGYQSSRQNRNETEELCKKND